jgi:hypothetical protein
MRVYSEVIGLIANQMFGKHMGGSNDIRTADTTLLSYIYGVPSEQIQLQIEQQYKRVMDTYYAKFKNE